MVSLSTSKPGEALVQSLFLQNPNSVRLKTDKLMSRAPEAGTCNLSLPGLSVHFIG